MSKGYPDNAFVMFKDGDQWCCVGMNFVNLQESPAGFSDNMQDAVIAYLSAAIDSLAKLEGVADGR